MKFIIALFAALFIIMVLAICHTDADELKFAWDYDENKNIDGFRIYSGPMGQDEDGAWYPQLKPDPIIDEIEPAKRTATGSEDGWPAQKKKFCFIARAFKGDVESEDSNMVCKEINNLPLLAPANISGTYDVENKRIEITWEQEDFDRAEYWKIFYRIGDGDFIDYAKAQNHGHRDLKVVISFTAVADGTSENVQFVIVAFKNDAVYSPDSEILEILIDRTGIIGPLPPVENFKFNLEIPVE